MCHDNKKIARRYSFEKGRDKPKGILYGVGIGPGDPELLTLKARKILKKVDIIFAPKPNIKSTSLAADIIKNYIPKKKQVRELIFPMTKNKKTLSKFWKQAAARVYEELSSGKDAAFVTIGDPFIYSTYIYLLRHIRRLDKELKVVTVPGISAINAASSLLEIPLAEADERFVVMPVPNRLQELKNIFLLFDTVVLLKIGKDLGRLVKFLKKEGLDKSIFFVKRIGYQERCVAKSLSRMDKKLSGYLSIMIVKSKKKGRAG